MTDRELLETAAKAAGILLEWYEVGTGDPDCNQGWYGLIAGTRRHWNPLTDDGDALRLAVNLQIDVSTSSGFNLTWASNEARGIQELAKHGSDPYAATRRAIVRAAVAIGATL